MRTTEHRLERLATHKRRLTAAPLDRARLRSRRSLGPRLRSEDGAYAATVRSKSVGPPSSAGCRLLIFYLMEDS